MQSRDRKSSRPAVIAVGLVLAVVVGSCAEGADQLTTPGRSGDRDVLPRLVPGGQAPAVVRGGAAVAPRFAVAGTVAPELRAAIGRRFVGGATVRLAADADADAHERHVLLENTGTGQRAAWVVSQGVITAAYGLGTVDLAWRIAGAGDFDSDGKEDVLWQQTGPGGDGTRALWLMNGAGGVSAAVNLGFVPLEWRIAGGGDYSNDGKDDVLWENTSDGTRAVWVMDGTGGVQSAFVIGTVEPAWRMTAAGDIDSDGKDDILFRHADGTVVLWLMSGGRPASAVPLGSVPAEWGIVATADVDGDAKEDVLWENSADGRRLAWLMNGAGGVTAASVLTIESSSWHIGAALIPRKSSGGGGGNVTFRFCSDPGPIWVGYQDDNGPWTQATESAPNTYSFNIPVRGAVAIVTERNIEVTSYEIEIVYATASELIAMGADWEGCDAPPPPQATKRLNGSVSGVASTQFVNISMGPGFGLATAIFPPTETFIIGVPEGPLDLLALLQSHVPTQFGRSRLRTDKVILRRGINLPDGSTIPVLNFSGPQAVASVPGNLTMAGLGTDFLYFTVAYSTADGTGAILTTGSNDESPTQPPYEGVPSSVQAPGDLHQVEIYSDPDDGIRSRFMWEWFQSAGSRTVSLGPLLAEPAVTEVANSPYLRHRVQLGVQSEYNRQFFVSTGTSYRSVFLLATAGHRGSSTTWDYTVPDLTTAGGFNPAWAPEAVPDAEWLVSATGGSIFDVPEGEGTFRSASWSSPPSETSASRKALRSRAADPTARSARPRRMSAPELWRSLRRR